eukprot:scaffold586_cov68-Cylindrotheca_fusiformis.AAC.3
METGCGGFAKLSTANNNLLYFSSPLDSRMLMGDGGHPAINGKWPDEGYGSYLEFLTDDNFHTRVRAQEKTVFRRSHPIRLSRFFFSLVVVGSMYCAHMSFVQMQFVKLYSDYHQQR